MPGEIHVQRRDRNAILADRMKIRAGSGIRFRT
jgi:hypothetical protein